MIILKLPPAAKKVASKTVGSQLLAFEENAQDADTVLPTELPDYDAPNMTALLPRPAPPATILFSLDVAARKAQLGCEAARAGLFDLAISYLAPVTRQRSDYQHVYYEMCSQIFLELGEVYKSIIAASRAVDINPEYLYGHWTRARALREFGELESSHEAYKTALGLAPAEKCDEVSNEAAELSALINQVAGREKPVVVNGRVQGNLKFYETCGQVNHELVPSWRPAHKPVCCSEPC